MSESFDLDELVDDLKPFHYRSPAHRLAILLASVATFTLVAIFVISFLQGSPVLDGIYLQGIVLLSLAAMLPLTTLAVMSQPDRRVPLWVIMSSLSLLPALWLVRIWQAPFVEILSQYRAEQVLAEIHCTWTSLGLGVLASLAGAWWIKKQGVVHSTVGGALWIMFSLSWATIANHFICRGAPENHNFLFHHLPLVLIAFPCMLTLMAAQSFVVVSARRRKESRTF